MNKKIRKAVIPAAGLGTRFLPVTKAIPKEMIPIVDTPMIEYILDEAIRAGIEDIIFITAKHKESIENYFDHHYELEDRLEKKKQAETVEKLKIIAQKCNIISVRQKEPLGLGHAVLQAASIIGNEPFAVLLGDDLIDSNTPCIQQLNSIYQEFNQSVVGVMEVPQAEVSKYGIVAGTSIRPGLVQVQNLIEKPDPARAPSRLAIPGRYTLDSAIFDCIRRTPPGRGGEIQLTDALQLLAKEKGLLAYTFEGTRYDTGDRLGFIDATLAFALKRPELKMGILELLKKYSH